MKKSVAPQKLWLDTSLPVGLWIWQQECVGNGWRCYPGAAPVYSAGLESQSEGWGSECPSSGQSWRPRENEKASWSAPTAVGLRTLMTCLKTRHKRSGLPQRVKPFRVDFVHLRIGHHANVNSYCASLWHYEMRDTNTVYEMLKYQGSVQRETPLLRYIIFYYSLIRV